MTLERYTSDGIGPDEPGTAIVDANGGQVYILTDSGWLWRCSKEQFVVGDPRDKLRGAEFHDAGRLIGGGTFQSFRFPGGLILRYVHPATEPEFWEIRELRPLPTRAQIAAELAKAKVKP